MPGACCTRGLVCNRAKSDAHEHTGTAEARRHSPRNGFTAYAELSLETNSFCLHRCRISGSSKPGWVSQNLRQLDTSHGCQNHTVLPYAAARLCSKHRRALAPVVCALCPLTDRSPPCDHHHAPDAAASTASRPTFVTMANAPLVGTGWRDL
jgi:hypothetical protein